MTLKQALISESFYREPEAPNVIYINLSQIPNVEKLIEEVAETSYRKGAIDGTAGTITYESPEAFWKSHKERWLGK